jgi:hypothetical protein
MLLVGSAGLVLVALIGLGSARSHWSGWQPGGRFSPPQGHAEHLTPTPFVAPHPNLGVLIVVAVALLAVPILVVLVRGRGPAGLRIRRTRVRRGPLLVALWLLASALVALLVSRSDPLGLPSVFLWGVVAVAFAAVGAVALWLRLREPPLPPRSDTEDDSSELLTAVDLSLTDLDQEPDPRRAVIRAYARMEGALGLHGLARQPSETPLEYLARALGSLRVGRAAIERLTALFERAKFSTHEIDGSMKADALAALRALRDELAEPAS